MGVRLLALLAAASLVAWAGAELFHVPEARVEANRQVWEQLDDGERQRLRQAWRSLEAAGGERRELLVRRMATLSRLIVELEQRDPALVTPEALEGRLASVRPALDGRLTGEGTLSERLRGRVTRQVRSLTASLESQGRLDPAERQRLDGLPYQQAVEAALDLLKHEEIFLYAEGIHPPDEPNDVLEMQAMSPLEVASRMRIERRRRGLMGRAARAFDLAPTELRRLDECSDEDLVRLLRELYQPKVRGYLEQRGLPETQIEEIVGQPLRSLELTLNRLELEGR